MRDILPTGARILTDDRTMLTRLSTYAEEWTPEFSQRVELAEGALFERYDAMGALASALTPDVPLAGGGRLSFEPTPALTAKRRTQAVSDASCAQTERLDRLASALCASTGTLALITAGASSARRVILASTDNV